MKVNVKINTREDALNWWHACNSGTRFGVDWKTRISPSLQKKIVGKTQEQAFRFLRPYLQKLYKKTDIKSKRDELQKLFDKEQDRIAERMENATGKKICREDFTILLTTFPRCPYNPAKGIIWSYAGDNLKSPITSFTHELNHFQVIFYFKKQIRKKLSESAFEDLKEALTVINNDALKGVLREPEQGYRVHTYLRADLLRYWKKSKNFSKLVAYGTKITPKYKKTMKYLEFGKFAFGRPDVILRHIPIQDPLTFSRNSILRNLRIIKLTMERLPGKAKYPTTLRKSRLLSAQEAIRTNQLSCGALATIVACVLRYMYVPVKLIDGKYFRNGAWHQHAWNEIYVAKEKKFIPFDITKPGFAVGKFHKRIAEYGDWSEMKFIA